MAKPEILNAEEFQKYLRKVGACRQAVFWAEGKSAKEAWNQCPRGDWLIWWCHEAGVDCNLLGQCYEKMIRINSIGFQRINADIVRSIIKPIL